MMKKIANILVACVVACGAWAMPARKGAVEVAQPDGSMITVYQHGDEFFHWMTNEQGDWLEMDKDGFYRITEGLSIEQIEAKRMASPRKIQNQEKIAVDLNIAPRGLVILVNFTDVTFKTSKTELDSMITGKNYTREYSYIHRDDTLNITSQGSAWQYFFDSSYGQYDPQFDVIGPVTVSKNMAYYGKNNKTGSDMFPEKMVQEACQLVDDSVDFNLYDNNADGKVDFVYVIYAGYGEADGGGANTIWPHSWELSASGTYCMVDGIRVNLYACGNELDFYSKLHTGIGTFCHEFCHVLGLPDLYVTNTAQHKTWGEWSILDYGPYNNDGNTPPALSAYERFFMGWLTPTLIVDSGEIMLEELNKNQKALLISENDKHNLIGNDPDTTVFYMLENRQQESWDMYLPGHGMMLTKVQYSAKAWRDNTVNNKATKMGVDIIEALPNNSNNEKDTDLFPAGATEYTDIKDHAIREIKEENGVIHFIYRMEEQTGNENTTVEDVLVEDKVVAVYNILGQKQATTDVKSLPTGTYVVVTTSGKHKIVR